MKMNVGDLVLYGVNDGQWLIGVIMEGNVQQHPSREDVCIHKLKWMWGTAEYSGFVGLTQDCADWALTRLGSLDRFGITETEVWGL